jgi:hydrogenase maturation protease
MTASEGSMTAAPATLVLGLGNVLCGDDGLGVAAALRLGQRYALPAEVSILDGGTLGLALLPALEEAEAVFILDAVDADAAPGTLVALEGEDVEPALRERLSPHQIGVADLLDALHWRGTWPARLRVLGLVPERMDLRVGLSAAVAAGLDRLVDTTAGELRHAGHALVPRPSELDDPLRDDGGDHVSRALGL